MLIHDKRMSSLLLVDDGRLETVEVGDTKDGCSVNVELLLCILIVIALSLQANTQPSGEATNSSLPHFLVQLGVKTDVLHSHSLLSELNHFLDGARSTLLELNIVDTLVKVDSVLALSN